MVARRSFPMMIMHTMLFFCRKSANGFPRLQVLSSSSSSSSSHRCFSTNHVRASLRLGLKQDNLDEISYHNKRVNGLLAAALSRARSTLANTATRSATAADGFPVATTSFSDDNEADEARRTTTTKEAMDQAIDEAETVRCKNSGEEPLLQQKQQQQQQQETSSTQSATPTTTIAPRKRIVTDGNKLNYRKNPAITHTALAQSLWASILRPHVDTAIDATCGNGNDAMALARLLFPITTKNGDTTSTTSIPQDSMSRLLCIDIQERACETTRQALWEEFGDIMLLHSGVGAGAGPIQVLQASHSPLPTPIERWPDEHNDFSSVALVVYNLGWLPSTTATNTTNGEGTSNKNECIITQMDTTLQSMVDAMLLLRIGGMLSVMTYPKTNASEDRAVRILLTCAALLSSNIQTWNDFLNEQQEQHQVETEKSDTLEDVINVVKESMARLVATGDACQTWRVSEHTKLGMDRAPILLTATRIK